ncbi:MAG TPA: helix-turn-helix domain-containing protein [Nitrospiria bacterium]
MSVSSVVASSHAKPAPQKRTMDLALEEFMEHRLKDFVKQMKISGGRNLYSILLREIERPLITITLKETNGNQIQAAHLLGMNRNTLRKKIKALKIRVHKNSAE